MSCGSSSKAETNLPERLDSALASRGQARSRTHAAKLIAAGLVTVDGHPAMKPSAPVGANQVIEVASSDHYVSRAAHKLIAALDAFELDVTGRVALDAGASTGGFTQVLLERGARHVLAIDVGHGQLASEIRADARVSTVEGFNIRELSREFIEAQRGVPEPPTLVTADLSFISLRMVLPAMVESVGLDADFVLLIKPQFEVGRTGIREGIVRDGGLREDAVNSVLWAAWDLGLPTAGVIPSPIAGGAGNREYLAWLSAAVGSNPTEWRLQVSAMA